MVLKNISFFILILIANIAYVKSQLALIQKNQYTLLLELTESFIKNNLELVQNTTVKYLETANIIF
jgi:hypothetical protein